MKVEILILRERWFDVLVFLLPLLLTLLFSSSLILSLFPHTHTRTPSFAIFLCLYFCNSVYRYRAVLLTEKHHPTSNDSRHKAVAEAEKKRIRQAGRLSLSLSLTFSLSHFLSLKPAYKHSLDFFPFFPFYLFTHTHTYTFTHTRSYRQRKTTDSHTASSRLEMPEA